MYRILYISILLITLIVPGKSAENYSSESSADFAEKIKDGIYYSGEVNKKAFYIRLDKTAGKGEFFFDTGRPETILNRFDYRFIGKKLIIDFNNKILTIQLSGKSIGEALIGAVSVKRKFLGIIPLFRKTYIFTLKPFNYPYDALKKDRYKSPVFRDIDVEKDVVYGRAEGYRTSIDCENPPKFLDNLPSLITKPLDLKMDIYAPQDDTLQFRPLVLLIHGGGFFIGSKECKTIVDLSNLLAGEGYVVAAIDYRIGFQPVKASIKRSGYRAIQDGRAALRFLAFNRNRYRIDPLNVVVMGTSAGAITSLNLAFLDEDERPAESKGSLIIGDEGCLDCSGNSYTDPFRIKMVVNMWGAVQDLALIDPENMVPVLSIHGDQDITVPYEYDYPFREYSGYKLLLDKMYGSKLIDEFLKKNSVKSELVTFKGFMHEPHLTKNVFNENYEIIKFKIREFLYDTFADRLNQNINRLSVNLILDKATCQPDSIPGDLNLLWGARGGFVTEQDSGHARVVWFENSSEHQLEIVLADQFRFLSKAIRISVTGK